MSKVEIDKARLKELERAEAKLNALERGGVDNWEWYEASMETYFKSHGITFRKNKLKQE